MNPTQIHVEEIDKHHQTLRGPWKDEGGRFDPIVAARGDLKEWLEEIEKRFDRGLAVRCETLAIQAGIVNLDWWVARKKRISILEAVIMEREPVIGVEGLLDHLRFRYGDIEAEVGRHALQDIVKIFPSWEEMPARLARRVVDALLDRVGRPPLESKTPHLDLFTHNLSL